MLISVQLQPFAKSVFYGNTAALKEKILLENITQADLSAYRDGKIILKGCGTEALPPSAYIAMTVRLQPIVKSLMFGEPCSTVPVYKKK